jgi:hypothetical protein
MRLQGGAAEETNAAVFFVQLQEIKVMQVLILISRHPQTRANFGKWH